MVRDVPLGQLQEGQFVDLVVETMSLLSAGIQARALWQDEPLLTKGRSLDTPAIWTLYGVQFAELQGAQPLLRCFQSTTAIRKPGLDATSFNGIAELCVGIGGISLGMSEIGGRTVAYVDKCSLACKVRQ